MRSLILGGARSGKSALAERIALQSGREVVYIATAQARDAVARLGPRLQQFGARRAEDELRVAPEAEFVLRVRLAEEVVGEARLAKRRGHPRTIRAPDLDHGAEFLSEEPAEEAVVETALDRVRLLVEAIDVVHVLVVADGVEHDRQAALRRERHFAQRREEAAVPTIPEEALVRFAGVIKVFVVRESIAHAVPVEPGMRVEVGEDDRVQNWLEVTGDLTPNDQVVTSGHSQLAEGIYLSDGDLNMAVLKFRTSQAADRGDGMGPVKGLHHFGFWVEDADEVRRRLEEAGAELLAKRNPTHNTGFFEEKWVAPDFTQFDIAQKGWSGAAPPTRDLREASEETEEPAHM